MDKMISKCPSCGSGLVFDIKNHQLKCDYCGTTLAISQPKGAIIERPYTPDYQPTPNASGVNSYVCASCGTSHSTDISKVSRRCPNCGSTDISESSTKTFLPDGIVPFELTKEQAKNIFFKWLKKKVLAPSGLVNLAKNGKISQVYIPVYNFNGKMLTAYTAIVKKVREQSDGAIFSTTHTIRDIDDQKIENVLLCANTTTDSKLLASVVKLDPNKIVPFSTEYLLGYYGADTNRSVHDCYKELENTYSKSAEAKLRAKLKSKYDQIESLETSFKLSGVTFNYTYVPVFVTHYTYHNKHYHCYVGGTSGQVSGKVPKSAGKVLGLAFGVLAALCAAAAILIKVLG